MANALLTIVLTNYNTVDFIELLLYALSKLTRHPYQVLINDNGSTQEQKLRLLALMARYPACLLHCRDSKGESGSLAHGRALDLLMTYVQTPYAVVFDSDAVVLKRHWDAWILDQLVGKVKMAGTPLGERWAGGKPTDWPLPFLAGLEMETFRQLGVSWQPILDEQSRPRVTAGVVQDTAWELRPEYQKHGWQARLLFPQNTRYWQRGPFRTLVGVEEYYTDKDCNDLFASHFGRGHSRGQAKYKEWQYRVPVVGTFLAHRAGERDIRAWIATCRSIIDTEAI